MMRGVRAGAGASKQAVYRALVALGIAELSYTWATLPAADSVGVGTRAFVTDVGVGGSHWFSDGIRWRPVGGACVIAKLSGDVSVPASAETPRVQVTIPPGLVQARDVLRLYMSLADNAGVTDTQAIIVRFGTAGTTADAMIQPSVTINGAWLQFNALWHWRRESATQIRRLGADANTGGLGGNATSNSAVTVPSMDANTNILSLTTSASGSDVATIREAMIELITG